jgi:hypothetical protein
VEVRSPLARRSQTVGSRLELVSRSHIVDYFMVSTSFLLANPPASASLDSRSAYVPPADFEVPCFVHFTFELLELLQAEKDSRPL